MPKAPLWLGAAGLIPFVSCAAGVAAGGVDLTLLSLSVTPDQLVHLQAVYGVNILSFMGGVHWGLAMANYQRPPSAKASVVPTTPSETKEQDMPSSTGGNREEWRYGLSVVPSLVGFGALGLFPSSPSVQLAALMAGFASVYAGDLTAASHQMVPRWYLKLRTPLTLIVLLSLGVSMRSVTLTEFGTEEGFSFMKNCARPEVADDEVLVRVKASAVAPIDGAVRRGDFAQFVRLPVVPGYAVSGVVEKLGMEVDRFKVGDEVIAVLPLDVGGGYAQYVAVSHCFIAYKPLEINHEEAVACLLGGIWSYTALHYHFKLSPGETVLVLNAGSAYGHIAVQLATSWGAKVIAAASSVEELNFLNDLRVTLDRVIDLTTESLVDAVMEETGGQGVDFLLETIPLTEHLSTTTAAEKEKREREMSPIISEMVSSEARGRAAYPSRRDLIRCLAPLGRWATSSAQLQLDPPDSRLLFLKGASLSFVFEQSWLLAGSQQGRLLHVLSDLMEKVSKEEIVPKVTKSFILEKIREAHRTLDTNNVGTIIIKH